MRLWVEPSALDEIATLPGHMRQRMGRAVSDLRETPRPSQSRPLEVPDDVQLLRYRGATITPDNWRIGYAVDEQWEIITVLAVSKRPPYNYGCARPIPGTSAELSHRTLKLFYPQPEHFQISKGLHIR